MKKLLFLFSMAAMVLASCGALEKKSGPIYGFDVIKTAAFKEVDTAKVPMVTGVKIQGKYVTITQDGQDYDYMIMPGDSFEGVLFDTKEYYSWIFYLVQDKTSCPYYKKMRVSKYMSEFLPADPIMFDYIWIYNNDDDIFPYEIKGKFDLPRQILKDYDQTSLPELNFSAVEYIEEEDSDPTAVPDFLKNAKSFVVKGTQVNISDGTNTTTLDIFPCSDLETFSNTNYFWEFYTKPVNGGPVINFVMAKRTKDDNYVILATDAFTQAPLGMFLVRDSDFKNPDNLKRKICVCYPYDDDYNEWLKNKDQ